jgi:hypothetical protein
MTTISDGKILISRAAITGANPFNQINPPPKRAAAPHLTRGSRLAAKTPNSNRLQAAKLPWRRHTYRLWRRWPERRSAA